MSQNMDPYVPYFHYVLGGPGFDPRRVRQHSFEAKDQEIFATVIISLPLIQEEQLSVSGHRMYINTG